MRKYWIAKQFAIHEYKHCSYLSWKKICEINKNKFNLLSYFVSNFISDKMFRTSQSTYSARAYDD